MDTILISLLLKLIVKTLYLIPVIILFFNNNNFYIFTGKLFYQTTLIVLKCIYALEKNCI